MKLGGIIKAIGGFISSHERILLTGVTIGAEIVAIAEAVKEGPTFEKIKQEVKERKDDGEEVSKKEIIGKIAVPVLKIFIPLSLSIIAAVLNHKKSSEAIQSLTSTVILGREAKEAYKASTKKNVEPEVAKKIEKEAGLEAARKGIESGVSDDDIIVTGHGNDLFYDTFSNTWFRSHANFIEAARLDLNSQLLDAWENEENKLITGRDWLERNGVIRRDIMKTLEFAEDYIWDHDTGMIQISIQPQKDDMNNIYAVIVYDTEPTKINWSKERERSY